MTSPLVWTTVLVVVVFSLSEVTFAWGPLSHSIFACQAKVPEQEVASCVLKSDGGYLAVGSQFPDAFAFGGFTLNPTPAYQCRDLVAIHDLAFAGHAILLAANYSGWNEA